MKDIRREEFCWSFNMNMSSSISTYIDWLLHCRYLPLLLTHSGLLRSLIASSHCSIVNVVNIYIYWLAHLVKAFQHDGWAYWQWKETKPQLINSTIGTHEENSSRKWVRNQCRSGISYTCIARRGSNSQVTVLHYHVDYISILDCCQRERKRDKRDRSFN